MAEEKYIEKAAEAGCEGENDSPKTIRLAGVVRESIVDGPGIRFVVFCQGCIHDCPGCQNPDTHDFNGGYDCDIQKILEAVDQNKLLVSVPEYEENLLRASGNIYDVFTLKFDSVNTYHILDSDKILFTKDALDAFLKRLA